MTIDRHRTLGLLGGAVVSVLVALFVAGAEPLTPVAVPPTAGAHMEASRVAPTTSNVLVDSDRVDPSSDMSAERTSIEASARAADGGTGRALEPDEQRICASLSNKLAIERRIPAWSFVPQLDLERPVHRCVSDVVQRNTAGAWIELHTAAPDVHAALVELESCTRTYDRLARRELSDRVERGAYFFRDNTLAVRRCENLPRGSAVLVTGGGLFAEGYISIEVEANASVHLAAARVACLDARQRLVAALERNSPAIGPDPDDVERVAPH